MVGAFAHATGKLEEIRLLVPPEVAQAIKGRAEFRTYSMYVEHDMVRGTRLIMEVKFEEVIP